MKFQGHLVYDVQKNDFGGQFRIKNASKKFIFSASSISNPKKNFFLQWEKNFDYFCPFVYLLVLLIGY